MNCVDLFKENIRIWFIKQYIFSQFAIICDAMDGIEGALSDIDDEESDDSDEVE